MIDTEEPDTFVDDVPAGTSLQTFLRDKHQRIAETVAEPLTLTVRGWDGALGIRYEYPEEGIAPILKAGNRLQDRDKPLAQLDAALDVILAAAREIVGRQPGESWGQPLEGRELRFGDELADMLGIDLEGVRAKSRHLCRHLFSPKARRTGIFDGDLVLVEHAGEVMDWLRKAKADADEGLSGE